MYTGRERRRYRRLTVFVVIHSTTENGEIEVNGFAKNISAGGVCLVLPERLDKESHLSLQISLPGEKSSLKVRGRVVWNKEIILNEAEPPVWELGIEFIDINEIDRHKIKEYVDHHL